MMVFLLVYVFTRGDKDGKAPIEAILPQASQMPLYRLLNDPFALREISKDVQQILPVAHKSPADLLAA